MKKRVLIIENEEVLRELMKDFLEISGYSVENVEDAQKGLLLLEENSFNIILLDLMLPGLKGLDFLQILRNKEDKTPVVIVSALNQESDIVTGLNLGADDYITKPFSLDLFQARIKAVLRRNRDEGDDSKEELIFKNLRLNKPSYTAFIDEKQLSLNRKEFTLLLYLVENRGRILTRDQILDTVWGVQNVSGTRTVDTHIATVRKKMGKEGVFIQSAHGIGYGINIK